LSSLVCRTRGESRVIQPPIGGDAAFVATGKHEAGESRRYRPGVEYTGSHRAGSTGQKRTHAIRRASLKTFRIPEPGFDLLGSICWVRSVGFDLLGSICWVRSMLGAGG